MSSNLPFPAPQKHTPAHWNYRFFAGGLPLTILLHLSLHCGADNGATGEQADDVPLDNAADISPIPLADIYTPYDDISSTGPDVSSGTVDLPDIPHDTYSNSDAGDTPLSPTDVADTANGQKDSFGNADVADVDIATPDILEPDIAVPPQPLHPQITEFLAKNDSTLADWEGEFSDWIELHNPHDVAIPLGGYSLTDDLKNPAQWIFPDLTLEAGAYLIIFASDKTPPPIVNELHASFKLDGDGESLALFSPTGVLVQLLEDFPIQLTDISFGNPVKVQSTPFVTTDTTGYYWVPDTSSVPTNWADPDFDTTLPPWTMGALPLGMSNQEPSIPPTLIADAQVDFSGTQGKLGWYYGYWDGTSDDDGKYSPDEFIPFPSSPASFGPTNYWTGSVWDWPNGNPPWTEITQAGGHPNGTTTGPWHWAIRRFISPVSGGYYLSGLANNPSENGDGTYCRILHNGSELEALHVDGTTAAYNIYVDLLPGDIVDFVIDPGPAKNDHSDGTSFSAKIHHPGSVPKLPPTTALGSPIADSVADWSMTGTQGENGWWYGYYDRSKDSDANYQAADFIPFPHNGAGYGQDNFWTSSAWDWYQGNPPWTYIGQTGTHPNSFNNSGGEHWTIRRYIAEIQGDFVVQWTIAKDNPNGAGVTGHVFHNGSERDVATIPGAATGGITRTAILTNVLPGDAIDIAHDPLGMGGDPYDGWDGSTMSAKIWAVPNLSDLAATDLANEWANGASALFVRLPFTADDLSLLNHLVLQLQYDDGFAAYLNGHLVASNNVPDNITGQSTALSDHPFGEILVSQPLDIDSALGFLNPGENVLAIIVLNAIDDPETLYLSAQMDGKTTNLDLSTTAYLTKPTPGTENTTAVVTLGPIIHELTQNVVINTDEPVMITAEITPISAPVDQVTLYYRVMFGAETATTMTDDGQGVDQVQNDGVFSAVIPANSAQPGQIIRWYIRATDQLDNETREPAYLDPTDSEQYVGGLVANPNVSSELPVFHWFLQNPSAANTDSGTRGGLWFGNEYYDNIQFDLHGQSTKGFPKKSYNVDFNSDHRFRLADDLKRMKDINWLTNYADKSKVRNTLSYETFTAVGSDSHLAFPIRIELNGVFFGLYDFVEDADNVWLERLGLDPDGALYKMYDTLSSVNAGEKKTRKQEDKSDLQQLIDGMKLPQQERQVFIYDHINLAAMAAYLTGMVLVSNADCCHKNYYAYRDTEGSGEWHYMPWDVDLTWGRNWTGGYFDDTMYSQNGIWVGANNKLIAALYEIPAFRVMFLRRLRTVMDEVLQPPTTSVELLILETRIAELLTLAQSDAALDFATWPSWGQSQTMTVGVEQLKTGHLIGRRQYLFDILSTQNGEIPSSQPPVTITFETIMANPPSQNPLEQYIALTNPESIAVDISQWSLSGDAVAVFPAGTVIPPGDTLYVSPDAKTFRARTESPTGGEGRFVQGILIGVLPPEGIVELRNSQGSLIDSFIY